MNIRFKAKSEAGRPVDLWAGVVFEGEKSNVPGLREELGRALASKKFSGKNGETHFVLQAPRGAKRAILVGLGKKESATRQTVRRAAARVLAQAKLFRADSLRFDLDGFAEVFPAEELAAAAVEGLRLSDYRFDKYKSKPSPTPGVAEVELVASPSKSKASVERAVREAEVLSYAVYFTRDLANEPANVMTPAHFADRVKEMASKNRLGCRVLGPAEIRRLKMGGLLGVSQGSAEPPRFLILENRVRASGRPIVLVGKGITFDTGGISIKPSGDMDKMKFDMCGAAAVAGAMKAIANLKLPVHVVGLAPVCENMPGSRAQRPGDIRRFLNGKTAEVLNTDAEGRLILADALSYAARYKPRVLVDVATLTGACAATFHDLAIGLMGTDADLVRRLKEAGDHTGERCWELPLWEEYGELIRATYADIQNISKKSAGTITAGMFLKEFAEHTRAWAHLDIAGTAWNDGGPKPLSPIGATGVGVRLLTRLVQSYS